MLFFITLCSLHIYGKATSILSVMLSLHSTYFISSFTFNICGGGTITRVNISNNLQTGSCRPKEDLSTLGRTEKEFPRKFSTSENFSTFPATGTFTYLEKSPMLYNIRYNVNKNVRVKSFM